MPTSVITGNGNWSSVVPDAPWQGGIKPAPGDLVTGNGAFVVDLDEDADIGASAAGAVYPLDITGGLELRFGAGRTLTVRGRVRYGNAILRLRTGSRLLLGGAGYAAGTMIALEASGVAAGQSRIINEAVGTHAEIKAFDGTFLQFTRATSFTFIGGLIDIDCGHTAQAAGNSLDLFAAAGEEISFSRGWKIRNFLQLNLQGCAATAHFDVEAGEHINPLASSKLHWVLTSITAATTGRRRFVDNVVRLEAYHGNTATWQMAASAGASLAGFTIKGNMLDRFGMTPNATNQGSGHLPTEFADNCFYIRGGGPSNYLLQGGWGGMVDDKALQRGYFYIDEGATGVDANFTKPGGFSALQTTGTCEMVDSVYQTSSANEEGDIASNAGEGSGGVTLFKWIRGLAVPNSARKTPGSWNAHDSIFYHRKYEGCTGLSATNTNTRAAAHIGATYMGQEGDTAAERCLIWSPEQLDNNEGLEPAVESRGMFIKTVLAPYTGKVTNAGSTTTSLILNTLRTRQNAAWTAPTAANQTPASSGAILRVLTGAHAGAESVITGVSGVSAGNATFALSPALPGVPADGDDVRIFVRDPLVLDEVGQNAHWNLGRGRLLDTNGADDGYTSIYDGMACSDRARIGVDDIDLGTGSDPATEGPKFVDWKRNFERAYTELFGQAQPAVWASGASYVVGDLRTMTTAEDAGFASYYHGLPIVFRCVAAHTAAATNRPGTGTAAAGDAEYWRKRWEPATAEYLRTAILAGTLVGGLHPVRALNEWVRAGFYTQAVELHGTGAGGLDIGIGSAYSAAAGVSRNRRWSRRRRSRR